MGNFTGTVANWDLIPPAGTTDVPYAQFTYHVGDNQYRGAGHRYSGCAFQGNLFTIQARAGNDLTHYLDLQNNPFYANGTGDITSTKSYAVAYDKTDSSASDRAVPSAPVLTAKDRSGAVRKRFLSAAVSGSTGAGYACWMAVPEDDISGAAGSSTPELVIWPMSVTQDPGQRPVVAHPNVDQMLRFTLSGAPTQRTNVPRDLCACVVGSTVYFFMTYWNDSTLYYFAFDGEGVSQVAAGPDLSTGDVTEIWSIDATTVYGNCDGQTEGSSPEMIAVAACLTQDGRSRLATQLLQPDPNATTDPLRPDAPAPPLQKVTDLNLPEPAVDWVSEVPDRVTVGTSIRIGWGSPWGPDQDVHPIGNGLMVSHVVRTSTDRFLGFGGDASYVTCVHLMPDGSPADDWQKVANGSDQLDGYFFMGAFVTGAFVQGVDDAMVYSLFLGGVGFDMSDREPAPGMYWIQWPSFRLVPTQTANKSGLLFDSTWTEQQFRAAVPSWTLLGVIAGTPPVPRGSELQAVLTVGTTSAEGDEFGTSQGSVYGITASVGGGGVKIGGGFSVDQSSSQSTGDSLSFTLTENHNYTDGADIDAGNDPTLGWLCYLVPAYTNSEYAISCYDNVTDVPGDLTLNVLSANSSTSRMTFQFTLSDLNCPPSASLTGHPEALLKVLSEFPEPDKNWRDSDDVAGWSSLIDTNPQSFFTQLTGGEATLSPPNPFVESPASVDKGSGKTATAILTDTDKRVLTSKNQVNITASVDVSVFDVSGSYSQNSTTTATYQDSGSLQVTYGINDPASLSTWTSYNVGGVILSADSSDLWWVPTISRNQRPWLVTWQVIDTS